MCLRSTELHNFSAQQCTPRAGHSGNVRTIAQVVSLHGFQVPVRNSTWENSRMCARRVAIVEGTSGDGPSRARTRARTRSCTLCAVTSPTRRSKFIVESARQRNSSVHFSQMHLCRARRVALATNHSLRVQINSQLAAVCTSASMVATAMKYGSRHDRSE